MLLRAFYALQKFGSSSNEPSWTQMKEIFQHFHQLEDFEDSSILVSDVFAQLFDDEFLESLASHLTRNEDLDKYSIESIKTILERFDQDFKPRRITESCLEESLQRLKIVHESNFKRKRWRGQFHLDEESILLKPILVKNKVKEPYDSFEEYLSVQTTLITEDFMMPLRKGLTDLKLKDDNIKDLHCYGNAIFVSKHFDTITIHLERVSKSIDWSTTTRLIYGSLVILKSPNLSFWTVKERNFRQGPFELVLTTLDTKQNNFQGHTFKVYESKDYLEAFKPVINALNSIKKIPFEDQLIHLNKSLMITRKNDKSLKIKESKIPDMCNESQKEAIKLGLTNKISLIQGPPGTGKSFVGTILAKTLIPRCPKPIVVICFTNHSLDQFLENLLEFKVVRIGGQSKSLKLEPFNLNHIKKSAAESGKRDPKDYRKSLVGKLYEKNLDYRDYLKTGKKIKAWDDLDNLSIINNYDVVGLTTTGAAKNYKLLRMLDPQVMIFEEAGQVLESHVLACLTPNLEQLILIGDHQQLKPSVSNSQLAKKYQLDTSLFERLILNDFPHVTLKEQYRMRPEISSIVRSQFYANILDHPNVGNYPNVKGMAKNLFFYHHDEVEESIKDSTSKSNRYEAEMILKLASYLINVQGYDPGRITILATYLGQMKLITELCRIKGMIITVVDNYQGEENDVILLSLVRSNETSSIGYLSIENRICVALSRAKIGLYIFGNMNHLSQSSEIWKRIERTLEQHDHISQSLVLKCEFHADSFKIVKTISDFNGDYCQKICGEKLNCGHVCQSSCHYQDRNHRQQYQCLEQCSRSCSEGHQCLKKCSEICHPCIHTKKAIFEFCGHENEVNCPSTNIPNVCKVSIKKKLSCGHVKMSICGLNDQICDIKCDFILDCGHPCSLPCHQDQNHNKKCSQPCEINRNCSSQKHPCKNLCFQDCGDCDIIVDLSLKCGHTANDIKCGEIKNYSCVTKCEKLLACGLHKCKNYCYECSEIGCGESNMTVKTLKCGHEMKAFCRKCLNSKKCRKSCPKSLNCGHPCPLKCFEDCSEAVCDKKCGEKIDDVNLNKNNSKIDCKQILPRCGHECQAKFKDCLNGQLHRPCVQDCPRMLICGHKCPGKCGQACQPCCKLKCLFQCQHKRCKSLCEDVCNDCKEKCDLKCDHSKCTKKCYAKCNRKPCLEQCSKKLTCGHDCLGFCGEPCPQEACSECNKDVMAANR